MTPSATTDRAAAVRSAMCSVVAERGLHDASMAAVARAAGVATGTAYVHYASKEELIIATYVEVKRTLGDAAMAAVEPGAAPEQRFGQLWRAAHDHLAAHPDQARFLVQIESSPLAGPAHDRALVTEGDALTAAAAEQDMVERFTLLPLPVLFDLSIGPVVRLVASGRTLDEDELSLLATACWRAVTR